MNAQTEMSTVDQWIADIVLKQRTFFRTKATLPVAFRLEQLKELQRLIKAHEQDLFDTIYDDFGKSKHHTQLTELFPLYEELETAIKNLAN